MPQEGGPVKFDFGLKDTELGWVERVDYYALKATPIWFSFLGWTLMLGALQYLYQTTGSIFLGVVIGISWVLFFRYLMAIFFAVEFIGLPFIKSRGAEALLSLIVSGILAIGCWYLMRHIVALIVENSK